MLFALSWWKEIAIAALVVALAGMTNLWLGARDDVAKCEANHAAAVKAAQDETIKAVAISTKTAKEINDAIPQLLESAKANAVENYIRRFSRRDSGVASGGRPDLGTGITLRGDGRMRDTGTDSATATQADRTESTQGEPNRVHVDQTCAPDPRFLADVATAAALLDGWGKWAQANGLEYE